MLVREFYFACKKRYANDEYINDVVIRSVIVYCENISDMSTFFLHLDDEIKNYEFLIKCFKRIENGEPYQYVIQQATFLGNVFFVDDSVLIPRMETEELVSCIISSLDIEKELFIGDIGTGSGCIAISLAKASKNWHVHASDISSSALDICDRNMRKHDVHMSLIQGDMLEPFKNKNIKLDVIVSNPPYIENKSDVDKNVLEYEPHLALFAENGVDFYENILSNVKNVLKNNGLIFFEFNYDQKDKIIELIEKYIPGSTYDFYKDAFLKWRYVKIKYHE